MPALFKMRARLLASVDTVYCASFLASSSSDMQTKTAPSYKFTAPLLDTPRSITGIPEELIKQTNATTFADALKTVPGITFLGGDAIANPSADRPVICGFESHNSIFVDGMRDSGVQNRETFDVERITVVKGPDSVYAGRGAVGRHGKQLLFVGWEDHLMFCAPHCIPVEAAMPFGTLVDTILPAMYASHPDWQKVDIRAAEWFRSGQPFASDFNASVGENGLGHKAVIRFRTPGLNGIDGSRN